jgi:hypothetical protein
VPNGEGRQNGDRTEVIRWVLQDDRLSVVLQKWSGVLQKR